MKKVLKILGILLGVIVLLAAAFLIYNAVKTHKTLNDPRLPDDYYTSIKTGGALEAKYVGRGRYEIESIVVPSDNKSIKNIRIYYPAGLKGTDRKYPLIMVVNGSQSS